MPQIWAGRTDHLHDWEAVLRPRLLAGLPERGRTVLGEAGLGKSTLVRRIAALAAAQGDWVTPQLRIPMGADPLKAVATALLGLADAAGLPTTREKRVRDLLQRVRSVSVGGTGLTVDRAEGPEPYSAITDLLIAIGTAAIDRDIVVLVHIDEVQNVTDDRTLSQLLVALGDALAHQTTATVPGGATVSRGLPIAVYLTGLPEFADMAGARKGATFARRFLTTTLTPIEDDDLRLALDVFLRRGWSVPDGDGGTSVVRMEPGAIDAIVELCRGEPFLFQLAGQRAWYAGTENVVTEDEVLDGWQAARSEAVAHVERILERLPRRERQLVEAMADLAPEDRTATTIARAMGFESATQVGPTTQRLDRVRGIIDRGRSYRFRHRAIEAYLTTDWPDTTSAGR